MGPRRFLDNPGVVRRVDLAEIIGRSGRDRVAAIRAVAHPGVDGHAARLAADMVAVVAISVYRAGPEAHGPHLASLGSHLAGINLALIIRWTPINRPAQLRPRFNIGRKDERQSNGCVER